MDLTFYGHRAALIVKKHAPEILTAVGIAGTIGGTVLACKATLKAQKIVDGLNEDLDIIHQAKDMVSEEGYEGEEYSDEDFKKDIIMTYANGSARIIASYIPAIMVGGAGIAAIVGGSCVYKSRINSLGAAYSAMATAYAAYRKKVADKFGDEERKLRYGIETKTVEEEVIDGETGKKKKVKKEIEVIAEDNGLLDISPYARFFDSSSKDWEKDPEYNMTFLLCQQKYANDILRSRGHLFLNEVYDMLGLERSKAGQIVGWVYDKNSPIGDNYIDFGIFNVKMEKNRDFVNGYENVILLDFNVDGNIYDIMESFT